MGYDEYLKSPEWRATREWALQRAERRCQVCGGIEKLDVHHNTYDRLGQERPADLVVLCQGCHGLYHGKDQTEAEGGPDFIAFWTNLRIARFKTELLDQGKIDIGAAERELLFTIQAHCMFCKSIIYDPREFLVTKKGFVCRACDESWQNMSDDERAEIKTWWTEEGFKTGEVEYWLARIEEDVAG